MNIKEWIFPLSFAIVMTYAMQYFLEPKQTINQVRSGAGFIAPCLADMNKPLHLDVDYSDISQDPVELHTLTTPCATYVFSNKGATLQAFSFPWQQGKQIISTLLADENCFLVAFEKNTPLMYKMQKMSGDGSSDGMIEFKANFDGGTITKIFTVHHDSYQIDLQIIITYTKVEEIAPELLRIFIAQPVMQPSIKWDKLSGIVNENKGLATIDLSKKDVEFKFWAIPTCFGYESRFIVHALIQDEENQLQRAYMTKNISGYVSGILESKPFIQSNSWKMKFFIGPKTAQALTKVDERLLKTLNFGWLAPISHAMLSALKYLHEKIGNYGWAIILLTFLLKLLMLPFTMYGEKNMRKGAEMQQKLAYLQKKYKNNPEMLEQARLELIKKHGVPGLAGCLPLLLTLPVLIGLNTVLSNAIELYGAQFLWIENLYNVDPYYILPILTGLVMLSTPIDNDPQKSLMRYITALIMATVACYFSAGLVLFILVNSAVAAVQTHMQKR